ncbi:DUF4118 domain-containing protein [Fimbriimonas ginsengisoli]|uniref:Integral membrane sensor signal transduction histidine kinase n=1 Tax=Fimbriimonas ginsengisoli Gsoil 348 TaxID=661478 RepID=A0A068NPU6_FIMGI|nr:DUF4118 domain-containing protein [Fimbriimonas ginsengisoli]AIE85461.1 integral membrane sensor signal transduction histidine kinase [Fimbriimonas ginsengisoli Gsoil 348]
MVAQVESFDLASERWSPMEASKEHDSKPWGWRAVSPYIETVLLICILTYVRQLAAGILEDRARYTLFFIAPCYSVWRGGLISGCLALVATCYIGTYFFLPPDRTHAIEDIGDALSMLLYLGVGLVIVLLGEKERAERRQVLERDKELVIAHAQLAEANEKLEQAVARRTAQLEELRQWAADEL